MKYLAIFICNHFFVCIGKQCQCFIRFSKHTVTFSHTFIACLCRNFQESNDVFSCNHLHVVQIKKKNNPNSLNLLKLQSVETRRLRERLGDKEREDVWALCSKRLTRYSLSSLLLNMYKPNNKCV